MRLWLFLALVALWPVAIAALAWKLAADLNLFASDPRQTSKLLVISVMTGMVMVAFGVRDWWKLFLPEVEPDSSQRFLGRASLAYVLVFAMTTLAYVFVWLVKGDELRYIPAAVAVLVIAGVRAFLTPERENRPTDPDILHSAATKVPASLKKHRQGSEDKA